MTERSQCPKCKTARVAKGYPDIKCLACGWSEPLIDFPVSWGWHRHYSIYYSGVDPGPNESPEHSIQELHDRLAAVEERLAGLSEEELRGLGLKSIRDEVDELKQSLRFTYKRMGEAIRAGTKPGGKKRIKTTEV
jgi:hypothetical protein